ncbi:MAG: Sua5 family C-terminal domain-containing protein, partial [Pseudomonadota bacterium]
RLFADLRSLDQAGCKMIAVMPIPSHGLGMAVNDRLHRAAVASAPSRALSRPPTTGGKRG